jgi:hypothetical protein
MTHPQRFLLGPQRPDSNLQAAVAAAQTEGPIAIVSAGWQEAEDYIDDVQALVGAPLRNLNLYHRAESVMTADSRLQAAYRERQEKLQELQRLYAVRLRQLMIAARQMYRSSADTSLLQPERRHAVAQLRALDRHHIHRVETLHAQFREVTSPAQSDCLAEHRAEILDILHDCNLLIITGGNVVVLLNRLTLFGLRTELQTRNIVAWSAGAMVLGGQIVLYHDRTPHGRRDAEVLGPGLGLLPDLVFLPDAKYRLKIRDETRIKLFSRRFAPATCLTLNSGALLHFAGDHLQSARNSRRLTAGGKLASVQTT